MDSNNSRECKNGFYEVSIADEKLGIGISIITRTEPEGIDEGVIIEGNPLGLWRYFAMIDPSSFENESFRLLIGKAINIASEFDFDDTFDPEEIDP